jgi:hypothetical protein
MVTEPASLTRQVCLEDPNEVMIELNFSIRQLNW